MATYGCGLIGQIILVGDYRIYGMKLCGRCSESVIYGLWLFPYLHLSVTLHVNINLPFQSKKLTFVYDLYRRNGKCPEYLDRGVNTYP